MISIRYWFLMRAITGSAGPNSTLYQIGGTHPIDGKLFTNRFTGSGLTANLIANDLASAITKLKQQKDYDGNPILFNRFVVTMASGPCSA